MHKRKIINPNMIGLAGVGGLLILGFLTITPEFTMGHVAHATLCKGDNGYVECDASSTINTHARIAPVVSIGMQSDVVMDVVPKSTGVVVEEPVSVRVSTNSVEGYSLYMKALGSTNALTSTTPGSTSEISAVDGGEHGVDITTLASQGNVWGYSLDETGSTSPKLYQAVPVANDQPVRVTDSVASEIDNLELTFALSVDTSLPSGTYNNSVIVSAVANPVTITDLNGLVFMQDMTTSICANTAYDQNGSMDPATADTLNPVTKQLIDTRDGKKYWVAKLKDGKCWMTQNLALDLEQGRALSPSDTNIAEPWVVPVGTTHENIEGAVDGNYGSFNPGKYVFNYSKFMNLCVGRVEDAFSLTDERCADHVTNVVGWNDGFVANDSATTNPDDETYDAHYLIGNYYAPRVVAAGSAGVSADYDICPKNWRMPTSNSKDRYTGYTTADYYNLLSAYDGSGWTEHSADGIQHSWRFGDAFYYGAPFYFVQAGYIFVDGTFHFVGYAYYWQSNDATNNSPLAMSSAYGQSTILPFITNQTQLRTVRCVAR